MSNSTSSGLPEPFCYYKAILKNDHLHFGLWPGGNIPCSMENAQENMVNRLLSFFPSPPAEVLDVGCGLGLSAHLLAQKGYRVTAIAPSPEMIGYARQTYGTAGINFVEVGFFDEDESVFVRERYDILLFQESAQYLSPLDEVVKKARRLLKDNGFLIIGDETLYDESIKAETAIHLSRDFVVALSENGFRIIENQMIGKEVFPTYDFVIWEFTQNKERIIKECAKRDTSGLDFFIDGWNRQKNWNLQGKLGYEIFVARKDSLSVVPYSAGDEGKILPTFNEIFGVRRTLKHWYWEFRDNPYGSYNISEVFAGDGKLLAHYAGYPVPFYNEAGGPPAFVSFQIGDTMTRPEVRQIGRGKTSLLARTAQHFHAKYCGGTVPFTYGFNTGTIKKLGERFLGYRYVDPIPYRIRDVKASPLRRKSLFEKIFAEYSVRTVNAFDDSFDRFFKRSASSYVLLVERGSRYLTWRYLECPDKDYIIVSACKGGEVVGWSVFLRRDFRLIWGDALFDKEHPDAVEFLLRCILSMRLCEDIETVEGWFSRNPVWWNEILDRLGFDLTGEPNNLFPGFFILKEDDWLGKVQGHFYYTMGDSDLF